MATYLPFAFLFLSLAFLVARWRLSLSPAVRVSRETAALQDYLAWKPAEGGHK